MAWVLVVGLVKQVAEAFAICIQAGAIVAALGLYYRRVLGFVFAFISAAFAVKWMVGYRNRHGMEVLGYYRIPRIPSAPGARS